MLLGDYSSLCVPLPDSVGNEQIQSPDEMKSHFRKLNTGPPLRDLPELAQGWADIGFYAPVDCRKSFLWWQAIPNDSFVKASKIITLLMNEKSMSD